MMIEIGDEQIEALLKCKKTKQRGFHDWCITSLLHEAILEFYGKYGEK